MKKLGFFKKKCLTLELISQKKRTFCFAKFLIALVTPISCQVYNDKKKMDSYFTGVKLGMLCSFKKTVYHTDFYTFKTDTFKSVS